MKVVIIGGVAGGASAAARLRRLNENAQITIYEKSGFVSYANCGLPYYIGDVITDKNQLTLQTPISLFKRFNIDVKINHEVLSIDTKNKNVVVKDLSNNSTFVDDYDKLILAPGARPIKPNIEGIDNPSIFTLRNVEDTYKIKVFVETNKPQNAVIVGGGYIGIEVAENLVKRGIHVTIIERQNQVMNIIDSDMVSFIHSELIKNKVDLLLNQNISSFVKGNDKLIVNFENHQCIKTDMVLLAMGVVPDSTLANNTDIELGIKGSIVVNDRMQTSNIDVYAVGDAVQIKNYVSQLDSNIALAGPANKQGRIAADNICGLNSKYKGSLGSSIIKIFDLTVASTGLNEKQAILNNIPYDYVILSPSSHADYYPGGSTLTLKVLFNTQTFELLGAQIVGNDGVDKRIDVIATAIYNHMKADELKDLDLAYAPPFSSAKDPVNVAGLMIENIKLKLVKQYHINDVEQLIHNPNVTLLDTRTTDEYARGHITNTINIPVNDLRNNLNLLDKNKPIYVNCQSGLRSYIACRILSQNGFDCYNLAGGYRFYEQVSKAIPQSSNTYACGLSK